MDETAIPPSITTPKERLSQIPANAKTFWRINELSDSSFSRLLRNLVNNLKVDRQLLVFTLIYLVVLTTFHWGLHPALEIVFFLAGGLLGVIFLDLMEAIFKMSPLATPGSQNSSFKNVLVQVVLVPFSLFVITSSGSLFGVGLILSLFLSMIYRQRLEFKETGNLNSWFWVIKTQVSPKNQQIYLTVMAVIFVFLSLLFV